MEYREFVEKIILKLKRKTKKEVKLMKITKNNGVLMDAVCISAKDEKIAPTIYLNDFFEEYQNGKQIEEIVKQLLELGESKMNIEFEKEDFIKFNCANKRIVYKLVNIKRNEKMLEEVPHIDYLDLAIVFYFMVSEENNRMGASIQIRNEHLKIWNICVEELFRHAVVNTPNLLEPEIKNMREMFKELIEEDKTVDMEEDFIPMYVLTNRNKLYGATCILYPFVLKKFANELGKDLYILPSSVHEVILVPQDGGDTESLSAMVREVNSSQVRETEILADHVYLYNREEDKIIVA